MHGVKKSDLTAARKAKMKKNVAKYKKLNAFALSQKRNKIYTNAMLETCAQLLTINNEHYTVWNYRREILLHMFFGDRVRVRARSVVINDADNDVDGVGDNDDADADGVGVRSDIKQNLMDNELALIVRSLHRNPKSYCAFFHREWCIKTLDPHNEYVSLKNELLLCTQFLSKDARNFHCWDYRRFIVRRAMQAMQQMGRQQKQSQKSQKSQQKQQKLKISLKSELKYSANLISENFSNYSAWHYRSTIITQMYGASGGGGGNGGGKLLKRVQKELEFAKNALYTEPGDQSAWLYQRWLLFGTMAVTSNSNGNGNRSLIDSELAACEELLEEEPNAKWALLASITLIKAQLQMDEEKQQRHHEEEQQEQRKQLIRKRIALLIELDADRSDYYQQLLL